MNSKVVSTIWDAWTGKWKIKVEQNGITVEDEAHVLINGSGILNRWRWPDINGLHSFKGKLMHTAAWDQSLDWTGKRVAIVGNGSSAIQVLPQMQPKAAKVTNFIRTATWISANYLAELTPEGKNFQYTEEQKRTLREKPGALLELRKHIESTFNKFFYALLIGTPEQKFVGEAFQKSMEERLKKDPELCAKLIPEWQVGCRRLTPGEGYLEALQEGNVSIEFNQIEQITEKGIKTAKGEEEFDIIVCATGFDVSFTPHWEMAGKNGIKLADQWRDNPEAYLGICATNMPNYFIFNGPNCPVGHGSLIACMGWAADYILRWCKKIAIEDIKYVFKTRPLISCHANIAITRSVTVGEGALADYNTYTQEFMKRTVWTSGCRSWYKNHKVDGKVTAMYAGSILHFKEMLESFRTEDFNFEYNTINRFRFMGNGLTILEEKGEDLAYYVK